MRRFLFLCFVGFISLFAVSSVSLAGEKPSLNDFSGEWVSSGDAFGQSARSHLNWTSTLGGKFYHIDYRIKMGAPEFSTPMFSGVGYYKPLEDGTFKAFWADSSGDLHPIRATQENSKLTSIWGVAGEKLGRTEYLLIDTDTLQVTDWIMKDHAWKQFNQNTFTRAGK